MFHIKYYIPTIDILPQKTVETIKYQKIYFHMDYNKRLLATLEKLL